MMDLELKKNITDAKGRVNYLKEKLDKAEAMDIYTNANDKNFNKLSESNYNNRRVETYTNWLLKASKGDYDTKTDKQYNDAEKAKRFTAKGEGLSQDDVFKQADKLRTNGIKYKDNKIKVTKSLINENSELGEVLRAYEQLRETLSIELQKVKTGQATREITILNKNKELVTVPLSFKMIKEHLVEVNADMKLSITYKKGLDYLRPNPTKPASLDIDYIDYGNWEVVKILLSMYHLKEQGSRVELDEIIIVADINKALEAIKLNANDMDIIEKYNSGYSITDLSKELGLNKSSVSRKIDKICKLIAKQMS